MSGNFFEKIATLMNVMKARVKHSATATLRGDARREDTASSLLELPGADRCPPVVRFQMIIDYIRRFDDVFMKCKQLDAVADRMARLSVERLKADVATNYEIKELRRLQKYLVLRGMDTKSAHTQTPRVPQPSAKKIVKTVRFVEPIADTSSRLGLKFAGIKRMYKCLKTFSRAVKNVFEWTAVYLEEPVLLSRIAEKIVCWSGNLVVVTVGVNARFDETSIDVELLPNIPRRPAA